MSEQQLSPTHQKLMDQHKAEIGYPDYHIPDKAKVVIGIAAAIAAAAAAYDASRDGLESFEDKANGLIWRAKNRKNAHASPAE